MKRQRQAVARNAPALALARQALQKPIAVPLVTNYTLIDFKPAAGTRELARQFSQEADVRVADGDFAGAMNSKLDIVEMGVGFEHGTLISMLTGVAIEAVGRRGVENIVSHLDAAQCRAAAERLKAIEGKRPSYAVIVKQEQQQTQILLTNTMTQVQNQAQTMTPEGLKQLEEEMKKDPEAAALIALIKTLTPEKIADDTATVFAPILASTAQSYQQSLQLRILPDTNPYLRDTSDVFIQSNPRFNYERSRAANVLLLTALELRAEKLEKGAYPATFVAPVDPFSPEGKPLVYKKAKQGYLLYSVGPDGKDDGGGEIQTLETNETTGVKTVTDRLRAESLGDIVQNPF